ncbi:MFS transporter [Burkholderia multivorans]
MPDIVNAARTSSPGPERASPPWQRHERATASDALSRGNPRIVLGICVAMGFTTLLDQAIFTMAVPRLRDGLHASPSQLQLILSIYSVAFGVALVPAGRLGDIIGRRSLFLFGLAVFTGFSVLGGLAWSPRSIIVARLLQGLGAGIINTQVLGLIQDLFHGQARARALGHYASAGGLSAAAGPLIGGLVLALTPPDVGWRLLFLVNVPFGVGVFVLAWRHLPAIRPPAGRLSLDLIGLALLSVATLALMLATLVSGTGGVPVRVWLVAAAASLLLFVCWEVQFERRGGTALLTRGLVRSSGYVLGTAVAMFQFAAGLTVGMVTTLFFLDGLGVRPLTFAALSVAPALGMMVSSTQSWRFAGRFGRTGVAVAIAAYACLIALQGGAMLALPVSGILIAYPAIGLLQGAASGLIHAPNQAMTLADAGAGEGRGVAAGFLQLSQRLACAIGLSWGAGIFFARLAPGASLDAYRAAFGASVALVGALSCGALLAAIADARRRRAPAEQTHGR